MKGFLWLVAIFVSSTSALDNVFEMKDILHKIHDCAAQEHATAEEVNQMLKDVLPQTKEGACTIFCIHKLYNVQSQDGSFNFDKVIEALEKFKEHDDDGETAIKAVHKCKDVPPVPDPCDFAEKLAECFVTEAKALGITHFIFM